MVAINARSPAATDTNATPGDYHIIPVSRIQSFQIVSLASVADGGENGFASAQPSIGPVDTIQLKQREQRRLARLKEDEANRGKGVTKEAQAIFDSFKRMYVNKLVVLIGK